MPNPQSLIFLPDISGFTHFVKHTEIEHSQHIISELLELIIDANMLDLELAEIEGDALFFYKHNSIPTRQALLKQIEEMYIRFHNHLQLYEKRRICECGACSSASELNLKFIAHAGNFGFIKVKDQEKPYGEEVIVAHRLMKNHIDCDDYALISGALSSKWEEDDKIQLREEIIPIETSDEYGEGDVGNISYQYFKLDVLKKHISPPPPIPIGAKIDNPLVREMFIAKPVEEVFELVSNFDYRLSWNDGVDELKYDKDRINRMGTTHSCVVNSRLIDFETISTDFGDNKLVYGERTDSIPLFKEVTQYYILESDNDGTKLRIEMHPKPPGGIAWLVYPFVRGFFGRQLQKALNMIKRVAENGAVFPVLPLEPRH